MPNQISSGFRARCAVGHALQQVAVTRGELVELTGELHLVLEVTERHVDGLGLTDGDGLFLVATTRGEPEGGAGEDDQQQKAAHAVRQST